jgi:hypothetical protein
LKPIAQARAGVGQGRSEISSVAKEFSNELVESKLAGDICALPVLNIYPASFLGLHPMTLLQLPVTGADRIWVQMEAAGEFARAGQALAGLQLAAEDAKNDLSRQLIANADFATS